VLPAGSGDAGDLTRSSILAEAQTAHTEITHIGSWTTAKHTAVVFSYFELGSSFLFNYQ
jgi:hypothetical protein